MITQNFCQCDGGPFIKLPICGLTPAPAPEILGRERVERDIHIYINGDLESSGDGLSPDNAVKNYEDAVLALSRYDGCNMYSAYLHFLSLKDTQAAYPDFGIYPAHYATFTRLYLSGESHETTNIGGCTLQYGVTAVISDVCAKYVQGLGADISLAGKVSFQPESEKYGLIIKYGGRIKFQPQTEIYLNPGIYYGFIYSIGAMVFFENMQCFTLGPVTMEYGFIYARYNSSVLVYSTASFSGCTSLSGKKYYLRGLSYLGNSGVPLPGSEDGVALSGSVYE